MCMNDGLALLSQRIGTDEGQGVVRKRDDDFGPILSRPQLLLARERSRASRDCAGAPRTGSGVVVEIKLVRVRPKTHGIYLALSFDPNPRFN